MAITNYFKEILEKLRPALEPEIPLVVEVVKDPGDRESMVILKFYENTEPGALKAREALRDIMVLDAPEPAGRFKRASHITFECGISKVMLEPADIEHPKGFSITDSPHYTDEVFVAAISSSLAFICRTQAVHGVDVVDLI